MKTVIINDINEVFESTLNTIVKGENTLLIGDFNKTFINLPQMIGDDNGGIPDDLLERINNSGLEVVEFFRNDGAVFFGKDDLPLILVSHTGLMDMKSIKEFFFNYIKNHGYDNVEFRNTTDILVDGKKVFSLTHSEYTDFNIEAFHFFVTLSDKADIMRSVLGDYYNTHWYEEPGYLDISREDLKNDFIKFLEDERRL